MWTIVMGSIIAGFLLMPLSASWGEVKTWHFKIDGMFCPVCPVAISKSIRQLKGVKKVEVSFAQGSAVVVTDASINAEDIMAHVQEAGKRMGGKYTVTLMTR